MIPQFLGQRTTTNTLKFKLLGVIHYFPDLWVAGYYIYINFYTKARSRKNIILLLYYRSGSALNKAGDLCRILANLHVHHTCHAVSKNVNQRRHSTTTGCPLTVKDMQKISHRQSHIPEQKARNIRAKLQVCFKTTLKNSWAA